MGYCRNNCDRLDQPVLRAYLFPMSNARINARLSAPLARFVDEMVGQTGLYETSSEYVRDLIRRDMEKRVNLENQARQFGEAVLQGYHDAVDGRVITSTGNFRTDMEMFRRREAEGWK